jgi:uncharacterized damage-inducible protein DinB
MSIRTFYDRWPQYNRRITEVIATMTDEQLALRPRPDQWPIWAIVGHMAGTRTYWLCGVLREPGAEATPFADPLSVEGWEDDLDRPRTASELVNALDSTFAIIDRVLDAWTPGMLAEEFERSYGDDRQLHSRTSVLQRMMTHEAYHSGEISQTLGAHGLPEIYIWRPY